MKTPRLPLPHIAFLLALVSACSSPFPTTTSTPTAIWDGLLQRTPYPYSSPLPSPRPSSLDGLFFKLDDRPLSRAPCRRCPPYPPIGGEWRLQLDRGIFRVYHVDTGWVSIGSFSLQNDRILFFNDPNCVDATGAYAWRLEGDQLFLATISDDCGEDLRARTLSSTPWTRD